MKTRKTVVLVLATIVLGYPVALGGFLFVSVYRLEQNADRGRRHLFFETDYNDLRAACKELSGRVTAGRLRRGQYKVRFFRPIAPEAALFPKMILDLKPCVVSVGEDSVEIDLLRACDEDYGVRTYSMGPEGQGNVKLIDGLWYYDYRYDDRDPKYKKKVDDLMERGRQQRESLKSPSLPEAVTQ